ncbi:MAG: beta-ketoacyl synthase N-terminal-like domain-containing protein [Myxococcales bacterium]
MIAAVVGAAWRTPLGREVGAVASRLLAGERAARSSPLFDASSYRCALGAAIPDAPQAGRHRRFLDRLGLHALEAGVDALAATGLRPGDPRLDRTGLFVGTAGPRPRWEEMLAAFSAGRGVGPWACGLEKLHPFWMLQHLTNNAHALLSMEAGIRGEGATFGGGIAGAEALLAGARALQAGAVDLALVVAYDSLLASEALVDLGARGVVAECRLESLRPAYDEEASGIVPGEAAVAVVLARPGDVPGEAGRIDVATGADGSPLPTGEPRACAVAEIASRVSRSDPVVDGAAWSLRERDDEERREVSRLVASGALLTASSAAFGTLGAAAPVARVVAWIELLRRRSIPPIAGLRRAAGGPLSPVAAPRVAPVRSVLLLSSGRPGLASAVRLEVA